MDGKYHTPILKDTSVSTVRVSFGDIEYVLSPESLIDRLCEWSKYRVLGTPEDFRRLKEDAHRARRRSRREL